MNRRDFTAFMAAALVAGLGVEQLEAHMEGTGRGVGSGMRRGMGDMGHELGGMGGCPTCGHGAEVEIPENLPAPENRQWTEALARAYRLERLSQAQYETDSAKFGINMPYRMIIDQEAAHIDWIQRLYKAYGLAPAEGPVPPLEAGSAKEAFAVAMKLEQDLVPEYQVLITTAHEPTTAAVLDTILRQTRWHFMMFSHHAGMMGWG